MRRSCCSFIYRALAFVTCTNGTQMLYAKHCRHAVLYGEIFYSGFE